MKALALALMLGVVLPGCAAERAPAPYGEPVRFSRDREVAFRDFRVRFLGVRRVAHPVFKPGFIFYDFEVTSPRGAQTVSWSSGTGVIEARSFTVDGSPYEFELRATVARRGWLRDDEFVVWPRADFEEVARRRR